MAEAGEIIIIMEEEAVPIFLQEVLVGGTQVQLVAEQLSRAKEEKH